MKDKNTVNGNMAYKKQKKTYPNTEELSRTEYTPTERP